MVINIIKIFFTDVFLKSPYNVTKCMNQEMMEVSERRLIMQEGPPARGTVKPRRELVPEFYRALTL